jgi:signal peptidase
MRDTTTKSKSNRGVALLGAAVTLILVLAVAVLSGTWQLRPVLSGSMRPGLSVGGVVVTQREPIADLQVRDVIVTHPPGEPGVNLIHRVIEIKSKTAGSAVVQTMGDANPAPDPFTVTVHGPWIYKARFAVPFVGYPAVALHSPLGRRITLAGALLVLAIAGLRIRKDSSRRKQAARQDGGDGATGFDGGQMGIVPSHPEAAPDPEPDLVLTGRSDG